MKKKIIIGLVVLIVLVLVGGGGAVFMLKSKQDGDKPKAKESKSQTSAKPAGPPVFDKLGEFTVNLTGDPNDPALMQLEIHLELADVKLKDSLKAYSPKIQSEVSLLLAAKSPSEMRSTEGKKKLMTDIRDLVNQILQIEKAEDGVREVAITRMIVQ